MTFRACADPASRIPTESGVAPFRQGMVCAKTKAAPPGLDGSRLLWYAMGDLRAAPIGVETGPRSVPRPPLRAFLFGKVQFKVYPQRDDLSNSDEG